MQKLFYKLYRGFSLHVTSQYGPSALVWSVQQCNTWINTQNHKYDTHPSTSHLVNIRTHIIERQIMTMVAKSSLELNIFFFTSVFLYSVQNHDSFQCPFCRFSTVYRHFQPTIQTSEKTFMNSILTVIFSLNSRRVINFTHAQNKCIRCNM